MRLVLGFNREDKQLIAEELYGDKNIDFMNGVNLSTVDGKQAYINAIISGKNPFKKQEESDEDVNINVNIKTSWADIIKNANSSSVVSIKANLSKLSAPFDNDLLNVAYRKKLEEMQMETTLSSDDISNRLLSEFNNSFNQDSIQSAVKLFHNMSEDILMSCEICGYENETMWVNCAHCGASSDGLPNKHAT